MKYLISALAIATLIAPVAVQADQHEIQMLKDEIRGLLQRLEALEAKADQPAPPPVVVSDEPKKSMDVPKWVNNVGVKGDLRYRHEQIDQEGRDGRVRNRVRARLEVNGKVNDKIKAGLRLASGGDDPVSTNQSLDSGAATKDTRLDLAYFSARPGDRTTVIGGKMKNPFIRTGGNGLVWDGDLTPEGIAVKYASGAFFLNAMGFWLEERSSTDDSLLLGGQGGYSGKSAGGMKFKAGLGYYDYQQTKGTTPLFDGDPRGNTVDANGNYASDFDILQLFGEASLKLDNGQPLSFFADYVQNLDADMFDTGFAFGAKYGKASKPGTWDIGYVYQDLEADAVIGLFTDSDFGGGGTDVSGHIFKFGYSIAKNFSGKLTFFLNESGENAGNKLDYNRLQADLIFKY